MVLLLLILLAGLAWAILAEIEKGRETQTPGRKACPSCGEPADADWLICPHCRFMLREHCGGCGQQRSVFHRYCPHCGGPAAQSRS